MAMIIARATAASAAATVMMKMAKTWPVSRSPFLAWWANAAEKPTSVTLTALSMISMLIRIATALRLLRAPKRPIQNRTAPRTTNEFSVTMGLLLAADHDGADDGDQEDDRGDFKWQDVAVGKRAVEELAEPYDRAGRGARLPGEGEGRVGRAGDHLAAAE